MWTEWSCTIIQWSSANFFWCFTAYCERSA